MDLRYGLYNGVGGAISASSVLGIRIKRDSDDWLLDFNDTTFKAAGHVALTETMAEIDAVNLAGEYEELVDASGWDDGSYTIYYIYSGTVIIAFVDHEVRWVYDGLEVAANVAALPTAVLTSVVDTLTLQEALTVILALLSAKASTYDSGTGVAVFQDQSGVTRATQTITDATVDTVIP